uniref:Uncharacterized protein n=1 Tax=Romanomermis culicivorax TaxID=13658 RepID=A0A915IRN7_ROMCU
MAAMMGSVGCGSRLLLIVATVAVVLVIAVIVINMGIGGIIMSIETNGTRMAGIAAVVGGIAAAGGRSEGLRP